MRIAILSDIHGNLTAFEAVLADLDRVAPDVILHGGDLADSGARPVEVVDRVRSFGWLGVMGNGEEMLSCPESLDDFARQSSAPSTLWVAVRQMAAATRALLGEERLSWLGHLPLAITRPGLAVVHASPENCWTAPSANATDTELEQTYSLLARPIVIFGHTHLPAIRPMNGRVKLLINGGSVGLPFDGDPRASYVLVDGDTPSIRRVDYDLEKELNLVSSSDLPRADWICRTLRAARPQMP